ncbi:MAG: HNH endonuclease domain-containing protein [Methylophilaceae bacterium]|nr:HNH endonuclease domain-containing protein [Methylophilaceae bacterium]
MEEFILNDPSLETQWRSLILFGKNSATYKFAFAKSLLDLVEHGSTVIYLEELALTYSSHIVNHLRNHDKQGSSQTSQFLEACRNRRDGLISDEELYKITLKKGFVNVVDAFQNVAGGEVLNKFYEKDYSGKGQRLIITDDLLSLKSRYQYVNLNEEVEGRWRLVETAWNVGISPHLIQVEHNIENDNLFLQTSLMKRLDVTSARSALNGYQKGKCFYCYRDISINSGEDDICHVDHFLPHVHKREHLPANINGVWNLVLSCSTCNGSSEKGARVAEKEYLLHLYKRNEFYILSQHPLAETIVNQTGNTTSQRQSFLNKHYQIAYDMNPTSLWKPKERFECLF